MTLNPLFYHCRTDARLAALNLEEYRIQQEALKENAERQRREVVAKRGRHAASRLALSKEGAYLSHCVCSLFCFCGG